MGHGGHGFKSPLSLHDFFPSWNLIIFSIYWFLALLLTYINQKKSLIISFYNFQNLDSVSLPYYMNSVVSTLPSYCLTVKNVLFFRQSLRLDLIQWSELKISSRTGHQNVEGWKKLLGVPYLLALQSILYCARTYLCYNSTYITAIFPSNCGIVVSWCIRKNWFLL